MATLFFNNNILFMKMNFNFKQKSSNYSLLFYKFLYRNIKFFYCFKKNKFWIQDNMLLSRIYFFKYVFLKLKKINYFFSLNFIFLKFNYFFIFFRNLFNLYNNMFNLFFFKLKLKGLGYVLKRFSKYLFSFLMAVNHFFYFFVPSFFLIKKKKKNIICLSLDKIKLNIFFWHLLFIKKHNVYVRTKKINGFIKTNFVRFMRKKYKL